MTTTTCEVLSVISVRQIPAGSGKGAPVAPAIYAPHRTRDGRWVWRLIEKNLLGTVFGGDGWPRERGVYSEVKAWRIAEDMAADRHIITHHVWQNKTLKDEEIARFVVAC